MGIPATLGYTHTDAGIGHCVGMGIVTGHQYAHTDAKEGEGTMALDRRAFNRTVAAPRMDALLDAAPLDGRNCDF